MRIAKVAGLDNNKRGPFVVVVDKTDRTWLCSCNFVISDHPSPTGSPPIIPSSSADPNFLSPPTSGIIAPPVFYSQSTPNRLVTPPTNASIYMSTGKTAYVSKSAVFYKYSPVATMCFSPIAPLDSTCLRSPSKITQCLKLRWSKVTVPISNS
jgi:hypothetical protein